MLIDGSYGEAGGQILRTALALSCLFKEPIRVINIRKKRKPSGLKNQHMHAIKLLEKITNAKTEGIRVGSMEIYFEPKSIDGGFYEENIGTAGSITLLLQAVLLPCLFAEGPIELKIIGGTDVKHSPSLDYLRYVILPYLERFARVDIKLIRRGFYPKGGGEIIVKVFPKFPRDSYKSFNEFLKDIRGNIDPIDLKEEEIKEINIHSVASLDLKERKVAERMLNSAKKCLENLNVEIKESIEYVKTFSTGAVITIVAKTNNYVFGADSLGERGKPAEKVGEEAAKKLLKVIENSVSIDEHLADNLVPYLGLVGGYYSTYRLTGHLKTNIWVCEKFFGKIYKIDVNKKVTIYV